MEPNNFGTSHVDELEMKHIWNRTCIKMEASFVRKPLRPLEYASANREAGRGLGKAST
jgi:hypothetical protein